MHEEYKNKVGTKLGGLRLARPNIAKIFMRPERCAASATIYNFTYFFQGFYSGRRPTNASSDREPCVLRGRVIEVRYLIFKNRRKNKRNDGTAPESYSKVRNMLIISEKLFGSTENIVVTDHKS